MKSVNKCLHQIAKGVAKIEPCGLNEQPKTAV